MPGPQAVIKFQMLHPWEVIKFKRHPWDLDVRKCAAIAQGEGGKWALLELTDAQVSLLYSVVCTFQAKEANNWSSFVRRFDIEFRDDCVSCKFISASVCYLCGMLALQTIKSIPASNLPAKVMTGLFGVGMLNMPGDENKIRNLLALGKS